MKAEQMTEPTVIIPDAPTSSAPESKPNFFKRHKVLTGVGAFIAIAIAFGGVSGGGDATTDATTPSATTVEAPAAPEAEAPAAPAVDESAPGIGDPVSDGKFEFTVTGVETGVEQVGDQYLNETAQGSYTLVTMTITNTGDEPQTFFADNIKGTDSQGRELAADSMASLYATPNGSDVWMSEINPGNSITVTVAFDVADGESLTSIEVHDSAFSGGEEIKLS